MIKRVAALSFVLAAGACSSTPSPEAGEVRVIPLGGSVSLLQGGETTLLEEATTVDAGVTVRTDAGGTAEVQLPGDQSLELAPETQLRVDDRVSEVVGPHGSVLVRTGSPMTLRAGGAEIEATDAVFRVDKSSSVRLATYSGAATVLGSGVEPVTALREAAVLQGGDIPVGLEAMEVRPNDPWDAELLGRSIDLGLQLLNYERGLTRQLPSGREADAVSQLLQQEFSPRVIRSAIAALDSAAAAVVAAVVAQEAGRLDGGSAPRILSEIVALIQQLNANWIVVVAEWGLPAAATALTRTLRDFASSIAPIVAPPDAPSLATTSAQPAVGPRGAGPSDPGGPAGSDDPNPPGGGGGGGGANNQSQTQPPDPPPAEEDTEEDTQQEQQGCGGTVECTVEDILDPGGVPRVDSLI